LSEHFMDEFYSRKSSSISFIDFIEHLFAFLLQSEAAAVDCKCKPWSSRLQRLTTFSLPVNVQSACHGD